MFSHRIGGSGDGYVGIVMENGDGERMDLYV